MKKYLPFCLFLSGKIFTFQNRHNLVNGQLSTSPFSKESILLLEYSLCVSELERVVVSLKMYTKNDQKTSKNHHVGGIYEKFSKKLLSQF